MAKKKKKSFKKSLKKSFFLNGLAFTPPPLLVARPLVEELFFCGFPYKFQFYWSTTCSTAYNYEDRSTNIVINGNMESGATSLLATGLRLQLDDV